LACLTLFFSTVLNATDEFVGTLPGELNVDNKGASNYSIPLQVPPGVNGMQPNLALYYNSQSGNGLMGIGWGLSSGYPQAITRGRNFLARHGLVRGVQFDNTDKFYLDGKLLICVSGTYGVPGSVYRTEVDSFVTITSSGTGTAAGNSNIETFTLRQSNGLVVTYGRLGSSWDAYHGDGNAAAAYSIKQVRDTCGNLITFNYVSPVSGEYVLSNIMYGANESTGASHMCKIQFIYNESVVPGNQSGDTKRLDENTQYMGGRPTPMTARLDRIDIGMTSGGGMNVLSEYNLGYEYAPNMGPTRLVSVSAQLFDPASSSMKSVPATHFTWSDSALQYRHINVAGCPPYNDPSSPEHFAFGDVNGDGLDDRVIFGSTIYVERSDGQGFLAPEPWLIPATVSYSSMTRKLADINGDGMKDLIIGYVGSDQDGTTHVFAYLSTGSSFVGVTGNGTNGVYSGSGDFGGSNGGWDNFRNYESCASRFAAADFTGDGRDDILIHRFDGCLKLLVSTGTSFSVNTFDVGAEEVTVEAQWTGWPGTLLGYSTHSVAISMMPCDVTGDGIADYVWSERTGDPMSHIGNLSLFYYGERVAYHVAVSLPGGGFAENDGSDCIYTYEDISWVIAPGNPDDWGYNRNAFAMLPGDINGDGLSDMLEILYIANGHSMVFSTGTNSAMPYGTAITYPTSSRTVSLEGENVFPWYNKVTQDVFDGVFSYPAICASEYVQAGLPMTKLSACDGYGLCDVNLDGKDDFVWYVDSMSNPCWYVLYNLNGTYSNPMPVVGLPWSAPSHTNQVPNRCDFPYSSHTAFDLNGDGVKDYAQCNHYSCDSPGIDKYSVSEVRIGDKIIGITNGLGQKTEIKYKPTSDRTVYTPGPVDNPATPEVEGIQYPIREVGGTMYVVSDVYKDYGAGTEDSFGDFGSAAYENGIKVRNVYVVSYQYAGGRTDLSGRGFLGFQAFVTLDRQTNLFKYQFLAQSFPMTGLTVREQTYHAQSVAHNSSGDVSSVNLRLLSSKDNTVRFDFVRSSPNAGSIYGTLFPYTPHSWERRWEASTTDHFSGINNAKTLFGLPLPLGINDGCYSYISAFTWLDEQSFAANVSNLPTLPSFYANHANETAPGASGFADNPVSATPVGTTYWSTFMSSPTTMSTAMAAALQGKISYGNLKRTLLDYSEGYKTDAATDYYLPSGNASGRSDLVKKTQTSASTNGTTWQVGPVTRMTYEARGLPSSKAIHSQSSDTTPAGFRSISSTIPTVTE